MYEYWLHSVMEVDKDREENGEEEEDEGQNLKVIIMAKRVLQ